MSKFTDAIVAPYQRFNSRPRFLAEKPLLAHYTTVKTAEAIISNNQIWLSNPLLMNDSEELRFGLLVGDGLVTNSESLRGSFANDQVRDSFYAAYTAYSRTFAEREALDVYVFCLSQHDRDDFDGRLSMWRG